MPAKLTCALHPIATVCGDAFIKRLTYPGIFRGAPLSVTPVLIETGDAQTVVMSDADSDAAKALPKGLSLEIYGRYFRWDDTERRDVPQSFAAAVRKAAVTATVLCDPVLPQVRFEAIAQAGPASIAPLAQDLRRYVYRKAKAEIVAQWEDTRNADVARVTALIGDVPQGSALINAMSKPMSGFAALDRLMGASDMDALCVTAPHEVELFTGLPYELNRDFGMTAIWLPGDDILIATQRPLARKDFHVSGPVQGLSDLLKPLGRVGVQKNDMSCALWAALREEGVALTGGGDILRRFQDCRAGEDFVYFYVSANAMLHGIHTAKRLFAQVAQDHLTERDLVAAHHEGVRTYLREFGFEGRYTRCFDIVHSGDRTHLPATACDALVPHDARTVKFDMGIFLKDGAGCVRGVSDIARTICTTPELDAVHAKLRAALVNDLMPRIKPGMTGEEVHAEGVDCLRALEPELRAAGLLPEGVGVEGYTRDCGHTLQRQTISSVYFSPGNRNVVELGMLGCVEYVWPIGGVLLAVEDGYLVTEAGTIPFTHEVTQ